jgi:hypothetical protein
MGETQVLGSGALIASIISAAFGVGWIQWGAENLSGTAPIVIRVVGGVIGLVIIVRCIRLRLTSRGESGPGQRSMFASRGYRLVVAGEVIALVAGGLVLSATHQTEYQICWIALVVGVHFLGFGKLFATRYYYIGAALIIAAVAGTILGLAGDGVAAVQAVTGFVSGLVLLVAPAVTLGQYQAQQARLAV